MEINLATTLGLTRLDSPSKQDKIITFGVWANTHSSGAHYGVRDATPGFLQIIPHSTMPEDFKYTPDYVNALFQNSDRRVIFPFSILSGCNPRKRWSVPGDMGIVLDSILPVTWPYTTTDTVLDSIKDFDLETTMRDLYTHGPQSVVIRNKEALVSGVCRCLGKMKDAYRCNHTLHTKINKMPDSDLKKFGNSECRLSFFKPSECLPFFGENHGAVVHLTIAQSKACSAISKFFPMLEVIGLFTNNMGAFCNVDGGGNLYNVSATAIKAIKIIKECKFAFNSVGGAVASAGKT